VWSEPAPVGHQAQKRTDMCGQMTLDIWQRFSSKLFAFVLAVIRCVKYYALYYIHNVHYIRDVMLYYGGTR
jgi:hypothetical protein